MQWLFQSRLCLSAGALFVLLPGCISRPSATLEALGVDLTPFAQVETSDGSSGDSGFFVTAQNQQAFELSGSCSEPGGRIELVRPESLRTETLCSEDETWSLTLNLSSLSDGNYRFELIHFLRNERRQVAFQSERYFKITSAPPAMSGVPPRDGVQSSGNSVVLVWAPGVDSAGNPLVSYEYAIGNQSGVPDGDGWTSTGSSTQATVEIPDGASQVVYVYIRGVDSIGQSTAPELTEVHVDDAAPDLSGVTLGIASPTSNSLTQSPMVSWSSIAMSAADGGSGSGVEKVQYQITGQSGSPLVRGWTDLGGPTVSQVTPVGLVLQAGESYRFELRAIDFAGNVASPIDVSWSVDAILGGGGSSSSGSSGSTSGGGTSTSTGSTSGGTSTGTTSGSSSTSSGGGGLVDHDSSISGFGGGTRIGVKWQSGVVPSGVNPIGDELAASWTPKYASIVTYLKFNGADEATTLVDSAKGKTFTFVNQASLEITSSKLGGASAEFDGTDDRVGFPSSDTDFTFGTGDFAISVWFYPRGTTGMLYEGRPAERNGAYPTMNYGTIGLSYYQGGSSRVSGGEIRLSRWNHAVVTRVSNVTRLYLNGKQVGTNYTDNVNYLGSTPRLAQNSFPGGNDLNGLLDEFAIWKGQGLSASEVLEIYLRQLGDHGGDVQALILAADTDCDGNTQEGETEYSNCASLDASWTPKYSDIKVYLKLDGDEGSTSFVDSVGGKSVTATAGTASLSRTNKKVGPSSVSLTGGTSSGLNIASHADLGFGTGDFAVSGWFYVDAYNSGGAAALIDARPASTNGAYLTVGLMNPALDIYRSSTSIITGGEARLDAWHHVVVSRIQGTTRAYLNGVEVGSGVADPTDYQASIFRLGRSAFSSTFHLNGNVDEFAVWKGSGLTEGEAFLIYQRQSRAFSGQFLSRVMDAGAVTFWNGLSWKTTYPVGKPVSLSSEATSDYRDLSGNSLMSGVSIVHSFEGTPGVTTDNAIITQSYSGAGAGPNGTARNGVAFVRAGRVGGALEFDGTNDSVFLGNLSESNRSYSVWVYPKKTSSLQRITRGGSLDAFGVMINNSNNRWHVGSVGSGSSVRFFEWNHLVWVSGVGLYVNGELDILGTQTSNQSNIPVYLGSYNATSEFFQGRMDEFILWDRTLSADEVRELYRRGSAGIQFQVRACTTSDCSDSPAWVGSKNTPFSYLSEELNLSRFNFDINNCSADLSVLATSPRLGFSCLTSALSTLSDARYFQYRAILESDDQMDRCNYGEGFAPCSPELLRVEALQ